MLKPNVVDAARKRVRTCGMLLLRGALDGTELLLWGEPDASPERLPVGAAIDAMTRLDAEAAHDASVRVLQRIVRHAAAAVVRQEYVPTVRSIADPASATDGAGAGVAADCDPGLRRWHACWEPMLRPSANDALRALVRLLPEDAFAQRDGAPDAPLTDSARQLRVLEFVRAIVDHLVRARLTAAPVAIAAAGTGSVHDRWLRALTDVDGLFDAPDDAVDQLAEQVSAWHERLHSRTASPFRLGFRLEEPADPGDDLGEGAVWYLRFLVQVRDEPSIVVDVADAWAPRGSDRSTLERHGFHPGAHLFVPLGEAGDQFEPIRTSLQQPRPAGVELTTAEAHAFLREAAPVLEQAGFGIFAPAWWRARGGRFRASLRAHVTSELSGGRRMLDALNLATLVGYDWRLAIGDAELSERELRDLAHQKTPLLHVRGRWIELDADELRAAIAHVDRMVHDPSGAVRTPGGEVAVSELIAMSVRAGHIVERGLPVSGVDATGDIGELLAALPTHELVEALPPPRGLAADLRPYQLRGYRWLDAMARLGLGACLADDMGLGKTVQVLAVVQGAREHGGTGPTLVVCPTSVLTNWLRECQRFVPDLSVVVHHGPQRASAPQLSAQAQAADIVITSYAVLARDQADLAEVAWQRVVLDEAQNIKNPTTGHARAARALRSTTRIALTGTPVENHVGDHWSIMEFLNPGLLGSQRSFRQRYLLPIQTGAVLDATDELHSLIAPFVMRRLKTDRTVIADLPDKFESVAYCTLTTEQASLYEAIVADAQRVLRGPRLPGIDRRGLILATIAKLKQACNHPAQLLGDNSTIAGRSGKLERLELIVENVLDRGERALVFTQFVQMGELLQRHLVATFGRDVLFLHGGTSRSRRDSLIAQFEDPSASAPPVLVLSLKAGGSGLNLTSASHVVHYDRWWNPATEQQASDRAFRIGQTRNVHVHALVCAGTVEERIDRMLEQKRQVADAVVGSGERWITELADEELLDLIELRDATLLTTRELGHTGKKWERASL
ncbi:MAG: helicase [Thermoleophilia bacterium]|nr:helicase [Thermoleophilia bacterium]